MKAIGGETSEMIDHKTSQAICSAVGERLQRELRPQSSASSPHLEHLLEELRKLDDHHF